MEHGIHKMKNGKMMADKDMPHYNEMKKKAKLIIKILICFFLIFSFRRFKEYPPGIEKSKCMNVKCFDNGAPLL